MKTSKYDRDLFARDIYPRWKFLITGARTSITIYAPFFDQLLPSLLKFNKKIDADNINIVTDFRVDSLLEMPNQLRTIKKVLSSGISVLKLRGLHAKVLLIDDKYVTVGSQNFTSRGRKNKEASTTPFDSIEGSSFIRKLIQWRSQAEIVDEDLVDRLLTKLEDRLNQHQKLHKVIQAEFDEEQETFEREKTEAMQRRLEELEQQSHIRMVRGEIYATVKAVGESAYASLLSDFGYDMTHWIIKGSKKRYELNRLSMYPVIFTDTLRMGFARIGKTRITYVRNSLKWATKTFNIGELTLSVEINFHDTKTKKRNIKIILSDRYRGSCEFVVLFNGYSVKHCGRRYFKGSKNWQEEHQEFVSKLENDFFRSPAVMDNFFAQFFTGFIYAELDRDNKNIKEYLKGERYRLTVIQYQKKPFLVIRKIY